MGMRRALGAALLGLLLAGCSATQPQPRETFSVRRARPVVVHNIPPQTELQAMQFLTDKVGFMATAELPWSTPLGNHDTGPVFLLATRDGGRSWSRHALPEGLRVTGLDFTSAELGFLVGKTKSSAELWATVDGGATWKMRVGLPLTTKPYRETLDKVHVGQSGQGYALLDGSLYRTADGGAAWQSATLPPRTNDALFLSPTTGIAISYRTIWRTTDAGRNWQPVWQLPASLYVPDSAYLGSESIDVPFAGLNGGPSGINLLAASGSTAWAVFNEGSACAMPHCQSDVAISGDGGEHWKLQAQPPSLPGQAQGPSAVVSQISASAQGLFAAAQSGEELTFTTPTGVTHDLLPQAPGVGVAAFSRDGQGGLWVGDPGAHLFYEAAGARSFHPVWPPLAPTGGIAFVTRLKGYGLALVAGRYAVLSTRDGGRTWRMVHSFAPGVTPTGFAFTRTGDGYVFATLPSVGPKIPGQILRTENGGGTWRVVRTIGDASGWIGRVNLQAFTGQQVLQGLPRVRLSRDGGRTWRTSGQVPFTGAQDMLATWFLSPSDGWALDAPTGNLYRTASGGARWRKVGRLRASNFASIDFANARDGWVLAPGPLSSTKLLRTTNGGLTWQAAAMPQTAGLATYGSPAEALSFVCGEVGYLETVSGLYRTSDGGRTWSLVP